jgi:hypothetical protein
MINSIVETVKMHMVLEAFLIGLEKVKEKHQISEIVKLLTVTNSHSWKEKSIKTTTAIMLSLPKKKKSSSDLFLESGSAGMFPGKGVSDGWESPADCGPHATVIFHQSPSGSYQWTIHSRPT